MHLSSAMYIIRSDGGQMEVVGTFYINPDSCCAFHVGVSPQPPRFSFSKLLFNLTVPGCSRSGPVLHGDRRDEPRRSDSNIDVNCLESRRSVSTANTFLNTALVSPVQVTVCLSENLHLCLPVDLQPELKFVVQPDHRISYIDYNRWRTTQQATVPTPTVPIQVYH